MPKTRITGPLAIEGLTDAPPVKKDSGIDLTPFLSTLRASWDKKQAGSPAPGFAMTVPTEQVQALQSRFRAAAKEMGLGVAFDVGEAQNGKTRVTVEARKKKVMQGRTVTTNGESASAAAKPAGGLPKPPAKQSQGAK